MSVTIELWKDTGYTESGVERPPVGATLSNPDYTYYGLNPARDELFSSVQIKAPYTDLYQCSYLKATYDFNESDPLVLYGWIDSITLVSDTADYPNTRINWHVDLWRTYCNEADYKAGTIRRRPEGGLVPPQPYPYRYLTADGRFELIINTLWWGLFNYVEDDGNGNTRVRWCAIPVDTTGNSAYYISYYIGGNSFQTLSLNQLLFGDFEERYGIDPESVISFCLSPIAPCTYLGTGTSSDPIRLETAYGWSLTEVGSYAYFMATGGHTQHYQDYTRSLSVPIKSDDISTYVLTNFDGSTVGTLPWGLEVQNYTYRLVNCITGQYIQIRFDGLMSQPEGLCFTVPLPMLSVTSNSWSSYVYSGQREYDLQMRNAQTDQETERSALSTVSSILSTAGLGMMFGGLGTAKGSTLAKGAGATGIGGIVETVGNYASDKLYFNNEYQKWEDYKASNQTDNIILPGDGEDFIFHGGRLAFTRLSIDGYSAQQRLHDIQMYGVHVTEPDTDCNNIVNAGGPLQITNMTVGGNIPVEAKEYIRAMFSNGVRLV